MINSATLRELIARNSGILLTEINDSTDLYLSGMQSIDFVTLVLDIETEFFVRLPEELIVRENFRTPASISAVLEQCSPE